MLKKGVNKYFVGQNHFVWPDIPCFCFEKLWINVNLLTIKAYLFV
jgi:hypothetical protein